MKFVLAAATSYYSKVRYSDNDFSHVEWLYSKAYDQYKIGLPPNNFVPSLRTDISNEKRVFIEMATVGKVYGMNFKESMMLSFHDTLGDVAKINKITVCLCELKNRLENKLYGDF